LYNNLIFFFLLIKFWLTFTPWLCGSVEEEEDEEAQEEAPKDEAEIQVGGGAPPASVS
jgi:hypothetical protein